MRVGGALDLGGFRHHRFVERGAAGGVEDDRIIAAEPGRLQRALRDLSRLLAGDDRQGIDMDLLAEHGKLFHRRRAPHVERGHEHLAPPLLAQSFGELSAGGGFARALQTDHHDRHRRRRVEINPFAERSERLDQLIVHDLHDHLTRRHRFDDLDADGVAFDLVNEGAHHVEGDVGLEQRAAHFAQRGIDVGLGQRTAPRQAVENAAEPFRQRVEHRFLPSALVPYPARPGMR